MSNTKTSQEILYRYMGADGIIKTLESKTLRFSKVTDFNDPFEIFFENIFPETIKEQKESLKAMLIRMKKNGSATEKQIQLKVEEYNANPIKTLLKYRDFLPKSITSPQEHADIHFRFCCFCKHPENKDLIHWAHYGDRHQGARIRIISPKEYEEKIRPINYPKTTPQYKIDEYENEEKFTKFISEILFTKSAEWAYEQEVRWIRFHKEEKGDYLKIKPEWLKAIDLGLRMKKEDKDKVIDLARNNFPKTKIYEARKATNKINIEYHQL